jgi:hypothetical protein
MQLSQLVALERLLMTEIFPTHVLDRARYLPVSQTSASETESKV